ncbi:uncharacterized protein N7458_009725 [Penicillium daleae]|uniref:FAD dependent oxidoreductase domain-containing protein n=1 Tax=Penicillium daleae TaxID=63821 RepID=A0AAD6BZ75_9EURO|nr:uncharacterized protein N7458_009725 [Penicillium daleae]KAJ5438727.1 hypothetical protein N7458_009725 [Penicillium daleae]
MPPVPDGSSSDISRVVRFDYADDDYLELAYEAYLKWRDNPRYKGIFYPAEYILVGKTSPYGQDWITKTTAALDRMKMPWYKLESAASTKKQFPAVTQLRDDCFELGVSFICGRGGTVVGFETDSRKAIKAARTLTGSRIEGDHFILSAGAWTSGLVPMYNSTLSTAQVLGYIRLTPAEMEKFKNLPIYSNFSTGWFNFPPS